MHRLKQHPKNCDLPLTYLSTGYVLCPLSFDLNFCHIRSCTRHTYVSCAGAVYITCSRCYCSVLIIIRTILVKLLQPTIVVSQFSTSTWNSTSSPAEGISPALTRQIYDLPHGVQSGISVSGPCLQRLYNTVFQDCSLVPKTLFPPFYGGRRKLEPGTYCQLMC